MSRIIKFRGKRLDNGAWETGGVVPVNVGTSAEKWCISCKHTGSVSGDYGHGVLLTEVDPDTVGQFTGLLDKDGTEIYEGDLLGREVEGAKYYTNEIAYDNCGLFAKSLVVGTDFFFKISTVLDKYEIIGSIHENPELLNRQTK